jgi:hypothetical protein
MESIGVNGINSTSAGTVQYRRVNSYLSEIDITVVDGVSSTITGTVQYRRVNSYLSEIDITVVDGVNSTITGTVQYREKYNRRFVYQYW